MKVHIIFIPNASFSCLYLPAHHIPVYFRDLDAFMSDLPSQNTIYIQLSTLRDTLDVTIISSSVNKIIITKCTNVVLWFLKASRIRMRWNEKAVMLHFTRAYMQKIAKISGWGMYFLFLSATNKSQPWASACIRFDKITCEDELVFSSICSHATSRRITSAWGTCRGSARTVTYRFHKPVYPGVLG